MEETLFSLVRTELWGTWCTFLLLETGLLPKDHAARLKIIDLLPPKLPSAAFLENLPNLPELKERLENGARFSAALAPLDGGNLSPGTLAIWRLDEDENPYQFPEKADTHISGDSAQLATRLTLEAFGEKSQIDPVQMASDWIITGALDGERVQKVKLGNKLHLRLQRRWLIPTANHELQELPAWQEMPRFADSVKVAKKTISGNLQTRTTPPELWPDKVHTLFSFSSKSVRPTLAAALLSNPEHLHLLHSSDPDSIASLDVAKTILGNLLPDTQIRVTEIPSNDLHKAQTTIEEIILSSSSPWNCLFNVTNGNFLMRAAGLLSAKKAPGLRMVYRDFDNPGPTEFTQIIYKGEDEYITGILEGERSRAPNVNWDEFLERDEGPKIETGEVLLKRLKKNPESEPEPALGSS